MSNFAVLDLAYTHYDAGIYICVKTDIPCHLTLYHTTSAPRRHRTSRNQRGLTLPWGVYFCFVSWTALEQEQAGDTIYHLFNVYPWMVLTTKWFAFRGTINGELSPSVSALFEHKHPSGFPMEVDFRPYFPGDLCTIALEVGAPCPDHWKNVDDIIPDDYDSYVEHFCPAGSCEATDLYKIERGRLEKIESVTIVGRFMSFGTRSTTRVLGLGLKTHDTIYYEALSAAPETWTDRSWHHTTNPFTHQPWTQQELDTLQIGERLRLARGVGWGQRGRCTQVYAHITRGIICPP
ncbi:hypothetical protein ES708_18203 [subsurface metagenome]